MYWQPILCLGRLIDHELRTLDELAERMEKTEKLWNKHFPEEPYTPNARKAKALEDFTSSFLYDIASASTRQQMFFYQVRISRYCLY